MSSDTTKVVNPTNEEAALLHPSLRDKSSKLFIFSLAALACVATFEFGYQTTIVSPALEPITQKFGFPDNPLDSEDSSFTPNSSRGILKGVVVSSLLGTALIGALITGSIADKIGRAASVIITEVLFLLGATICALAQWYWMLVVGRLVVGLAVGFSSVAVPLLLGEISPPSVRGQMGVLNQLAITLGILASYLVGALLLRFTDSWLCWRLMFVATTILSVAHIVISLIFVRVESPRWLVKVNRLEDARKMLRFLRSVDDVEVELAELQREQGDDGGKPVSIAAQFKELLSPFLPILLATGIMFFQQISGINAVLYYLKPFLQAAKLSDSAANWASIGVGAINVLMTFITIPLIDRLGRKPLLLVSLAGMTLNLVIIGLIGLFVTATWGSIISVLCVVAFVMSFAIGMGACPWAVINEMFPSSTRALAVSLSLTTNWGINLFVSLLFPILTDVINMAYILFGFAVFAALAFVFLLILLPETKGKSVEEIHAMMGKKSN